MVVFSAEKLNVVELERPKKAVPVGTTAGLQLPAVLKFAVAGVDSQVASCADACPLKTTTKSRLTDTSADLTSNFATPFPCSGRATPPAIVAVASPRPRRDRTQAASDQKGGGREMRHHVKRMRRLANNTCAGHRSMDTERRVL
jgi:hypothetical protein